MKDWKTYLLSASVPIAVFFGVGHNVTLDVLIQAYTWIFLLITTFAVLVGGFGIFALSTINSYLEGADSVAEYLKGNDTKDVDKVIAQFKPLAKKPKFYLSIPLMVAWIGAFAYHEWTATAVYYFILTLLAWFIVYLIRTLMTSIGDSIANVAGTAKTTAEKTVKAAKKLKPLKE